MGARSGVMGRVKERVGAHDYRAAGGVSAVAAATLSPPGHCNRYSSTRKGAIGVVFFLGHRGASSLGFDSFHTIHSRGPGPLSSAEFSEPANKNLIFPHPLMRRDEGQISPKSARRSDGFAARGPLKRSMRVTG